MNLPVLEFLNGKREFTSLTKDECKLIDKTIDELDLSYEEVNSKFPFVPELFDDIRGCKLSDLANDPVELKFLDQILFGGEEND